MPTGNRSATAVSRKGSRRAPGSPNSREDPVDRSHSHHRERKKYAAAPVAGPTITVTEATSQPRPVLTKQRSRTLPPSPSSLDLPQSSPSQNVLKRAETFGKAVMATLTVPRGRDGRRPSEEVGAQPLTGTPQDHQLWLAAKEANADEVERLLKAGRGSVDYEMSKVSLDSPYFVEFKNRTLQGCQAIHVAAYYKPSKDAQGNAAAKVVELLLAAKASATCEAFSHTEGKEDGKVTTRKLQPIHLAASTGNNEVIKLLLNENVDPNTPAEISEAPGSTKFKSHYMPIHDAAWFKHAHTVKFLLQRRADISAANMDEDTALHLAARLGYVEIVQLLLPRGRNSRQSRRQSSLILNEEQKDHQKMLLEKENKQQKVALEVAVEAGRFNLRELYVFTQAMENKALLQAFVKVARACPEAASALLRSKGSQDDDDEAEGIIDETPRASAIEPRYRECMQKEALKRQRQSEQKTAADEAPVAASGVGGSDRFDVLFLADLVRSAPQAAVDVLDALTDKPEAVNQEHHPLPIRAHLPLGSDFCPLTCAYEDDLNWHWSPKTKEHEGGKRWHQELAPLNPKKNHEVDVQVVKMPGLAHPAFLGSLAHAGDHRMFTKLPILALLKFVWKTLHGLLIMDLACEAVAIAVISFWIVRPIGSELPTLLKRFAWCCVAAQGVLESTQLTWTGARYVMQLQKVGGQDKPKDDKSKGRMSLRKRLGGPAVRDTAEWFLRSWHRALLAISTVLLAISSQEEHWPGRSAIVSTILGTASFLHWANVLYELRAFQWTGQRLLPIMNSVPQIGGMLVILIFLLVGFLHAFWAMDRSAVDEIKSWQILTFLFIGDNFVDDEELDPFGFEKRTALVMLAGFGVFTFTVCAMNLFIAVLGDIYDQQQEQTICTFLKERARICCSLFMRPELAKVPSLPLLDSRISVTKALICLISAVVSFSLALWCCDLLEVNSWPAAIILAGWGMIVQLSMRKDLTVGWEKKHLWLCTSTIGAEEMFSLAQEQQEKMKTQGRVSKLKRYIRDTVRGESEKLLAQLRKEFPRQADTRRPSGGKDYSTPLVAGKDSATGKDQQSLVEQKRPSGQQRGSHTESEVERLRAENMELRSQVEQQRPPWERQEKRSVEAEALERLEQKIDALTATALAPRRKKGGRSSRGLIGASSPMHGRTSEFEFTVFGPGLLNVDEGEEDFSSAARPLRGDGDAPSRFAFLTCG